MRIDNLQYANWSKTIFRQMRMGRVDAVHVTKASWMGIGIVFIKMALG